MAALAPAPKFYEHDQNGDPLVGGKVWTYLTGTSTPLATYTDAGGGTPNANPVILDSAGRASIWLSTSNLYRFMVYDADDVLQYGPVDSVGGSASVQSLAASSGSSLIGFIQDGAGAVARTAQGKMRDEVNLLDFCTDAQRADIAAGTLGIDCVEAFNAAVSSLPVWGGVVNLPPGKIRFDSAAAAFPTSRITIQGAGGGDYTNGSATNIITDVAAMNMFVITDIHDIQFKGFGITNTAVTPTGRGITFTNASNCHLEDMCITGWSIGVRYLPGTTSPMSCFGCGIRYSNIVNNVNYNIDAQASTNGLTLDHVTCGGSGLVGLRFLDSNSLRTIALNCEGCTSVGVEINASSAPLNVASIIEIHSEIAAASEPTNGIIRLGVTQQVVGVLIQGSLFAVSGGTTSINALNGSIWTYGGGNTRAGSFAANDPITANQLMMDSGSGALDLARDINVTGGGVSLNFKQRNAANEWLQFSRVVGGADSVIDGNEQGNIALWAMLNGAMELLMSGLWDGNGNAYLQSAGYLRILDGLTAPGTAVGYASLYIDSADGDLKIKFGDGTVKTIVTDT